jgi:hypothetical protein
VRRLGFQIFQTIGSQLAVMFSALRAGRPLPATKFIPNSFHSAAIELVMLQMRAETNIL